MVWGTIHLIGDLQLALEGSFGAGEILLVEGELAKVSKRSSEASSFAEALVGVSKTRTASSSRAASADRPAPFSESR